MSPVDPHDTHRLLVLKLDSSSVESPFIRVVRRRRVDGHGSHDGDGAHGRLQKQRRRQERGDRGECVEEHGRLVICLSSLLEDDHDDETLAITIRMVGYISLFETWWRMGHR
jgi:hypothetical protein